MMLCLPLCEIKPLIRPMFSSSVKTWPTAINGDLGLEPLTSE